MTEEPRKKKTIIKEQEKTISILNDALWRERTERRERDDKRVQAMRALLDGPTPLVIVTKEAFAFLLSQIPSADRMAVTECENLCDEPS